ncbi:MAG: hypothetical protein LBJ93_03305 [Clostridiales bacterium]|nr:hypothetical protein [Clostridiales bacterium]
MTLQLSANEDKNLRKNISSFNQLFNGGYNRFHKIAIEKLNPEYVRLILANNNFDMFCEIYKLDPTLKVSKYLFLDNILRSIISYDNFFKKEGILQLQSQQEWCEYIKLTALFEFCLENSENFGDCVINSLHNNFSRAKNILKSLLVEKNNYSFLLILNHAIRQLAIVKKGSVNMEETTQLSLTVYLLIQKKKKVTQK